MIRLKVWVVFILPVVLYGMQQIKTGWRINTTSNYKNVLGTGGPDEYGYRWIDNDTVGGPTFNWIDITSIGTQVTGLGDDNVVGPFNIGFEFPYYWYRVNKFWVCSNGIISFSSDALWTSHGGGSLMPQPTLPNDIVAPLGGDLNPGLGRGEVYYWSNGVDTLIVSYIDMPEWHYGTDTLGSHTFQLILVKEDSSIIFQYGPQIGTFNYGHPQAPPSNAIGIENVTGEIGLQYLRDNLPAYNMYHDSLAIRFYPPDSTSYQVTDLTMLDACSEGNFGFFLLPQTPFVPWARVKNTGNQDVPSYTVNLRIRSETGAIVYSETQSGGPIPPQQIDQIDFPTWTAVDGAYTIEAWVTASGDVVHFNDSARVELRVTGGHTYLHYLNDTTTAGLTHWFGAGGGFGAKFTPPYYPTTIDTVFIGLAVGTNSTPGNAGLFLFDDDGPGGMPGTILASDTVFVSQTTLTWFTLIPSSPITITSGSFYVGYIQLADEGPDFAVDQAPPFSRNMMEYTGAWAYYRDREFADPWIRVAVNLPEQYIQPDSIVDIHAGNATLSVPNNGAIGFWSSDQSLGLGFLYPPPSPANNTLYYGSFAIGTDVSYVADAWYESADTDDRDFTPQTGLYFYSPGPRFSDEAAIGSFDDSGHPNPQGILVEQLAYAYDDPDYDDFVIIEYKLSSSTPVNDVYVGYFMDFDIDNYSQNEAIIDSSVNIAYMWYSVTNRYSGVVLLSSDIPANLSVLHNPTYVYPYQGCPDSIQIKFLNGTYSFPQSTNPDDWSVVVSTGPFTISSDPTTVAFAVVGGMSQQEIISNAVNAAAVYHDTTLVGVTERKQILRSPQFSVLPTITKGNPKVMLMLPTRSNVKLALYDILGRRVWTKSYGVLKSGTHWYEIPVSRYPSGIYFINAKANDRLLGVRKFIYLGR